MDDALEQVLSELWNSKVGAHQEFVREKLLCMGHRLLANIIQNLI